MEDKATPWTRRPAQPLKSSVSSRVTGIKIVR